MRLVPNDRRVIEREAGLHVTSSQASHAAPTTSTFSGDTLRSIAPPCRRYLTAPSRSRGDRELWRSTAIYRSGAPSFALRTTEKPLLLRSNGDSEPAPPDYPQRGQRETVAGRSTHHSGRVARRKTPTGIRSLFAQRPHGDVGPVNPVEVEHHVLRVLQLKVVWIATRTGDCLDPEGRVD